MPFGMGSIDNETRNEMATDYDGSKHLDNNVFHQDGRDTLKRTFLPGYSAGESAAAANIARENGDYGTAVKEGAKAVFDIGTLGKAGMTGGASGIVKTTTTPTGQASSEVGHAAIEKAGDTVFGKDNGTTKMLTPSLDTPSKDKPKSDDDGKSELQKLKDDPLGYLKDLPQRLWDKLRGKDDDDNQLAKDDNGKDPQGKDTPNDNPEKQPTEPQGKDGETPNGQPESPNGKGENEPNGESDPNGKGTPIQLPNAGGGHSAGLGGGKGAGTMGAGNPSSPVADPLLIALNTGNHRSDIKIVSHDEENSSKMLDTNQDGIANKISWIGKDTGALFYDENNNNQLDGFNELLRDGVQDNNGEVSDNGFDYVLKFLDTNDDKVLDAQDKNFNKVKVLSLDEDGNEQVQTLKDLEIKSLDLNYNEISLDEQHLYNLKGDNTVTQESTYTKENGEVGKLADVNLSYDTVNTQHTENIKLTAEQAKVANLKGFGFVRDLNQSATQSEDLNKAIAEYSQLTTKEEQLKYLDHLAQEWAKTSPYYSNKMADIQGKEFHHFANRDGVELKYISYYELRQMENDLHDLDSKINRFEKMAFESDETQNKLHILQQFYGQADNTVYLEKASDLGNVIDYIDEDYNNLKQDMYKNLLFQTRLNPYLQHITVNENQQFDFSGVENKFAQVYEQNPEKALVDLSEFLHYSNIGQLDPQLNQLFAQYYTNTENADELVDKEIAKNIMFPDAETAEENNSDELEILGEKISADIFPQHSETDEKIEDDFNDELAYMNYMPDPHYMEQEDKEPDDDLWI